jgi:subtilisin family serine protease
MLSGTSFSAAYVSGVVALMLERNPALKPGEVRAIVTKTARDLGAPGRDDLFGAGEADAFAAVSAVNAVPLVAASEPAADKAAEKPASPQETPPTRALTQPPAAMASGQSAAGEANRPAGQ